MLDSHGFDMWADGYDETVDISDSNNVYPFAGYRKIMNAIYGTIMKDRPAKILDIGIGTGIVASKLFEGGNDITGIDFSSEMLSKARTSMPKAKLMQFDFAKGLPHELAGTKFDFIVSTYALHHLSDEAKISFIQSLLGYLNETGSIIIGDVGFQNREDLEKCKDSCGDDWDNDEFYFVFSELCKELNDTCTVSYHPFSYCSGIMEIFPSYSKH